MRERLLAALQSNFGYSSFRPLQEEIIRDVLAKRDVFVLMPTGAGKSLCYQLPAIVQDGVTVVISPLISLMKDQVDGLKQNGVKAAFLNSSLSLIEQQQIKKDLAAGNITVLYVAPERLLQPQFQEFLQQLPINLFAIDEAHCISEWGHDFRPDYRELQRIWVWFPNIPIIALTATATKRVKQDILRQLHLTQASVYEASFNRPNLSYVVEEKQDVEDQVIDYIRNHTDESGIIYCQTREKVDSLTKWLQSQNITALPYHGGLTDDERRNHQERFITDDVSVIVATIAFGMGIDKPNVRYVIHHDLPANLERYYQETGRAGRDGLPSECLLFYKYGDRNTAEFFIRQKSSPKEQQVALEQLNHMTAFAESHDCRRKRLLNYFGEDFAQENCAACDNCLSPKQTYDATTIAQKILSCIVRLDQRFGANYVCSVLVGAKIKRILQLGHDKLSTYGIVADYSQKQLGTIVRELITRGYIRQTEDQYSVVRLTTQGVNALAKKEQIFLTAARPAVVSSVHRTLTDVDNGLFQRLRALRKQIGDKEHVPPYIIFSDVSLQEMASVFPQTNEEFATIKGVGEQKLRTYADIFLPEIIQYCQEHTITPQARTSFVSYKNPSSERGKSKTIDTTVALFRQGLSVPAIAKQRDITAGTVLTHLLQAYNNGADLSVDDFVPTKKQQAIAKAFAKLKTQQLTPVKEHLGEAYSFDDLRWVRAKLTREVIDY